MSSSRKNPEMHPNFMKMSITIFILLLFDDNKIRMARKPGKKQKGNPVGCTGEGK